MSRIIIDNIVYIFKKQMLNVVGFYRNKEYHINMKFSIHDVGIIRDTSIICDGVTIITGKNGSGKSSLAKSISSVVTAGRMNFNNFVGDCAYMVQKRLEQPYAELLFLLSDRHYFGEKNRYEQANRRQVFMPSVARLSSQKTQFDSLDSLISLVEEASRELLQNEENILSKEITKSSYVFDLLDIRQIYNLCIKETQDILEFLKYKINVSKYMFETIKGILNYSFHGQIAPIGNKTSNPGIGIEFGNRNFLYMHNSFEQSYIFPISEIQNAFYISDGCILDQMVSNRRKNRYTKSSSYIKPSYFSLEDEVLNSIMDKTNIVSQESIKDSYRDIFEILNKVWPHNVINQKGIYINEDTGLNIANEASGAKIFVILKLLLLKGYVSKDTLLVFDEPENHLHPEWQSYFAQLLLLINKIIGTKIICVTHSQTLLLAFDVYSKRFSLSKSFKVYFGEQIEGCSTFIDCSNNIAFAHKKLTDPYVFMGYDDIDY